MRLPRDEASTQAAAARIVVAAIRSAGIDPRKAADEPVLHAAVLQWVRGEMQDDDFRDVCHSLRVMKPWLAPEDG